MGGCDRNYCSEHRLLWRDHDSAWLTTDGAGQQWWETQDCPKCFADERRKRYERQETIYR